MELDKFERREKYILKLRNRQGKIMEELRKLPLVELKEPYQDGWAITIRIREDIHQRKDFPIIEQAINAGYNKERREKKLDIVKRIRRGEKSMIVTINKKKSVHDFRPSKKRLTEAEYLALPPKVQAYFSLDSFVLMTYKRRYYNIYINDAWIELKARPYIITHVRQKGGELESEDAWIDAKLEQIDREWFYHGKSFPRSKARRKTRDDIKEFMKGATDDIFIEKIPLEYKY